MQAVVIHEGALLVQHRPDPEPGVRQVLVRVRAAGINAADLLQRQGHYPAPPGVPADIPGMEFAGEVVGCGPTATRFAPGDRVMGVVGGGAQAQLLVVDEREIMAVPDAVGWVAAGGFPEVFTTAHDALFTQAGLAVGERVCIHGAAGGVGVAGVQLAVAAGADVVATVRSEVMRSRLAAMGVTAIDPADAAAHGPYDVILELVGGPNLPGDVATLAIGGRITVIGVGAGAKAEVNLLALMSKRGRIHGSTLRARPPEGKAAAARAVERHVLPHLAAGRVEVPIHATFPLTGAEDAYNHFAAGHKFGKIVLTVD
jgi:NADPH:quinone reductase-like Zn-dependent oxidoreductase